MQKRRPSGHLEAVKFLVAHGANVNSKNAFGDRPIDMTSDSKIEKFLLENGSKEKKKKRRFVVIGCNHLPNLSKTPRLLKPLHIKINQHL